MAKPHFDMSDASQSSALDSVRYNAGGFINKAGILPFYKEGGEVYYLFASPKPVRNPDDMVPFAMARGTRRMLKDGEWVYKDYGIHFYAADVGECVPLIEAIDSYKVKWVAESELETMVESGEFNARYVTLFYCISDVIAENI